MFLFDTIILSIGLAMDASCVSAANVLSYRVTKPRAFMLALLFAFFQALMPIIGYFAIGFLPEAILQYHYIVAFILLTFLGSKVIYDGLQSAKESENQEQNIQNTRCPIKKLTLLIMFSQAITTSIDALSAGVTLHYLPLSELFEAVAIISSITFVMCLVFIKIGKTVGTALNSKAEFLGGTMLIILGFKILIENLYL